MKQFDLIEMKCFDWPQIFFFPKCNFVGNFEIFRFCSFELETFELTEVRRKRKSGSCPDGVCTLAALIIACTDDRFCTQKVHLSKQILCVQILPSAHAVWIVSKEAWTFVWNCLSNLSLFLSLHYLSANADSCSWFSYPPYVYNFILFIFIPVF